MHSARMLRSTGKYNTDCPILSCNLSTVLFPQSETSIFFWLPEARGLAFLDPKFAQEHDAHISFGHSARVQQPAPARGWLPGRLPSRHPARAHASNRNRRAHPARSQNSDRACTQSVGFMHARVDGRPRMRWNGLDCRDGAGCSLGLRNLLRANSSARGG